MADDDHLEGGADGAAGALDGNRAGEIAAAPESRGEQAEDGVRAEAARDDGKGCFSDQGQRFRFGEEGAGLKGGMEEFGGVVRAYLSDRTAMNASVSGRLKPRTPELVVPGGLGCPVAGAQCRILNLAPVMFLVHTAICEGRHKPGCGCIHLRLRLCGCERHTPGSSHQ